MTTRSPDQIQTLRARLRSTERERDEARAELAKLRATCTCGGDGQVANLRLAASAFGRRGGSASSEAKTRAVRANGALGGRPRTAYVDAAGAPVDIEALVRETPAGWVVVLPRNAGVDAPERAYTRRPNAVRAAAQLLGLRRADG